MTDANENLWQAERSARRRLWRMLLIGLTSIFILILVILFWLSQPLLFSPTVSSTGALVDPARLETHVRKLSQEFYPRNYKNVQNLNAVADYIRSEFAQTGGRVSEQTFIIDGQTYRNIQLLLGPDSGERIVIGAHYDSAFGTPGADDNASGTAGLIELAHLLSKEPPTVPVELVAYTLEEPPFFGTQQMGSFHHARSLSGSGVKVRLMICLEMIGYFSDEPGSQAFPISIGALLYPSKGNFISVVGNLANGLTVRSVKFSMRGASELPVYSMNAPSFVPGLDFSDHRNYWHFGYDAVMVTDSAFYRNHQYHQPGDTAKILDYTRMSEVVKGVHGVVRDLSK